MQVRGQHQYVYRVKEFYNLTGNGLHLADCSQILAAGMKSRSIEQPAIHLTEEDKWNPCFAENRLPDNGKRFDEIGEIGTARFDRVTKGLQQVNSVQNRLTAAGISITN